MIKKFKIVSTVAAVLFGGQVMGSADFWLVQSQGNGYLPDGVRKVFNRPQLAPIIDDWATLSKKTDEIIASIPNKNRDTRSKSIPNKNRSTGSKNRSTEPGY